jgi:hypothetical protein
MLAINTAAFLSGLTIRDIAVIEAPASKREVPCDGCSSGNRCANEMLQCSAFRNWAHSGDYKDLDIKRLIRAFKSE